MICPNGHGDKPGNFCDECGERLELSPETQSHVQPNEVIGMEDCPACGYHLNHGHQEFCPGCGHQLLWMCK
jgi:rRNA maturation endonuclease Nob1